jgi:hypothetical protein
LRLIFFLSNKQADDYVGVLGISRTNTSFVTVAAFSSSKTGAPSGWHVLRLWFCVAPSPPRVAKSLLLATPPPLHMAYDEHDRNVHRINGFA